MSPTIGDRPRSLLAILTSDAKRSLTVLKSTLGPAGGTTYLVKTASITSSERAISLHLSLASLNGMALTAFAMPVALGSTKSVTYSM